MRKLIQYKKYLFLVGVVLLSRIPFLCEGFGAEEDSWGLVLSAYNTITTGTYEVSRFPGHPLQELVYILLFSATPFWFNFFSAIFSAIAVVAFYEILKLSNLKYALFTALVFAFTPVVYASSVYTIDYMWTIAFVLLSFLFLQKNKLVWSALFLAFAIGCRITAGAMLVPFVIYFWQKNKTNYTSLIKYVAISAILGSLFYVPIYLQYGSQFFDYYDQFPYPSIAKVFFKATIGVWGFVGFIAVVSGFIFVVYKVAKQKSIDSITGLCMLVILLFSISYLRLPQKSGYLITVIPFVLILLNKYIAARWFRFIGVSIISSSFLFGINLTDKLRGAEYSSYAIKKTISGQEIYLDAFSGPMIADYTKRKNKKIFTTGVIDKCRNVNQKQAVICGWWYNELVVRNDFSTTCNSTLFLGYASEVKMDSLIQANYKIYYLPEQQIYNDLLFNSSSTNQKASLFSRN